MNDYVEIAPELIGISGKHLVKMDHPHQLSALQVVASPAPQLAPAHVGELIAEHYGLAGDLVSLVSERDQNFRLTTVEGTRFVVKIANSAENSVVTDFQIEALLHIEKRGCEVAVPRIIRTRDGTTSTAAQVDGGSYRIRIVSYVPGRPVDNVPIDASLARLQGRCLAQIGVALREFEHPGDSQALLWDMQRAGELRQLVPHIEDVDSRVAVARCLEEFAVKTLPRLASLRSQVIHNDLNPDNILVNDNDPISISGVIDFGDMIRAPLIVDVAVAASYLRTDDADAMSLLAAFVAGYHEVTPLQSAELQLLYDCIRTRIATTITIMHWRASERPDDAYSVKSLQSGCSASRFLARLDAIPAGDFAARILQECGY